MSDTAIAEPEVAPAPLERRTWCYAQRPSSFEISPCSCGNHDTQWSEFVGHLWCDKCEKDFIPEHNGVFDGPIPVQTAALMGVRFDRVNLQTHKLERFDLQRLAYVDENDNVIEELGIPATAASKTTV